MKLSDLKLLPGSAVQLEFVNREEERFVSRVVGYATGKSLMVYTPKSKGRLVLVRLKQKVNVRLFSNTTVCAFTTQIIGICTAPFPYLHLEYPEDIAADAVRKSRRVSVELSSSIIYQPNDKTSEKISGTILDISTDGAKIAVPAPIGRAGDILSIVTKVPLGEMVRIVSLQATIRAVLQPKPGSADGELMYEYGVQFTEVADEHFVVLYGYVYSQIVETGGAV
jgi:c-di-GMP-binding flagellar brake protein YcgR